MDIPTSLRSPISPTPTTPSSSTTPSITMSPMPEQLLTVREVALRLRVDDTTVRRWIKAGILEAISLPHIGKRQGYRIRIETLNALLTPSTEPKA